MEASLTLFIISAVLLGVNCNCDLDECREEVRSFLQNRYFCNSTSIQMDAVNALRKCVFWEEEKQEECPEVVRINTPVIAYEIERQFEKCGGSTLRQQGRAGCDGSSDYFVCIGGLAGFSFLGNLGSIDSIAAACTQINPLLTTLDVCKSCIGNLIGDPWRQVQADVERIWGSVTSLLEGACNCATRIETVVTTSITSNSTCETIERISQTAQGIAQNCVVDLIESFQTFNWLTLAKNFVNSIAILTNNACIFTGGASAVVLGLSTIILVLCVHFLIFVNRN